MAQPHGYSFAPTAQQSIQPINLAPGGARYGAQVQPWQWQAQGGQQYAQQAWQQGHAPNAWQQAPAAAAQWAGQTREQQAAAAQAELARAQEATAQAAWALHNHQQVQARQVQAWQQVQVQAQAQARQQAQAEAQQARQQQQAYAQAAFPVSSGQQHYHQQQVAHAVRPPAAAAAPSPLPMVSLPPRGPPPAPAPAPAPAAKAGPTKPAAWPTALEAWATAQLSSSGTDASTKEAVSKEVFALVAACAKDGSLWARAWAAEPPVPTVRALKTMAAAREAATKAEAEASGSSGPQRGGYGVAAGYQLAAGGGAVGLPRPPPGLRREDGSGGGYVSLFSSRFVPSGANSMPLGASGGKRPRGLETWKPVEAEAEAEDEEGGGPQLSKKQVRLAARAAAKKTAGGRAAEAVERSWAEEAAAGGGKHWLSVIQGGAGLDLGPGGGSAVDREGDIDWSKIPAVQGTCTTVEKRYLRLIAPPDPADVRPLPVLQRALELVKARYAEGAKYMWVCEQLKSIRQDLAVQHVTEGPLPCAVYETHARCALECQDPEEYNKCQAQLVILHATGAAPCRAEFISYRLLYSAYSADGAEGARLLASLTPGERVHPWVAHAIAVCASVSSSNYVRFFRLYASAPNLGPFVLDLMLHRTRTAFTQALVRAMGPVRPGIAVAWIARLMRFGDEEGTCAFLRRVGGVIVEGGEGGPSFLDPRASDIRVVRERTREEEEFTEAGLKLLGAALGGAT